MKTKLLALLLALSLVFSFVACGNTNSTPETTATQPTETEPPIMSKDELLAIAEEVKFADLYVNTLSNKVKAQSLYCDKVIIITGKIVKIENNHVEIYNDTPGASSDVLVDVYLSIDDIMNVSDVQVITVVGHITTLEEKEELWGTMYFDFSHWTMENAYLVE